MALPTIDNQYTLDIIYQGAPFVQVAAKSGIDFGTLDVVYLGAPFWGLTPAAAGGGFKLYFGSTQVSKLYLGSTEITVAYVGNNSLN